MTLYKPQPNSPFNKRWHHATEHIIAYDRVYAAKNGAIIVLIAPFEKALQAIIEYRKMPLRFLDVALHDAVTLAARP
jgi:nitrate reductase beta subunit